MNKVWMQVQLYEAELEIWTKVEPNETELGIGQEFITMKKLEIWTWVEPRETK